MIIEMPGSKTLDGGAYQVQETHVGPPLSYISSKLVNAIEAQYHLVKNISQFVPDDLPTHVLLPRAPASVNIKADFLSNEAKLSFNYMITAFLGLHNRLGLMDNGLVDSLLEQSEENLKGWLTRVEFIQGT